MLVCSSSRADWSQTPLKSPVSELSALFSEIKQADGLLSYLKSKAMKTPLGIRKTSVTGLFDTLKVTTLL